MTLARDQVVVARATPGRVAHFPDIVRLGDGRLLAAYREGAGHVSPEGRIRVVESADGGQTWGQPSVAVDGPFDDRDPKLAQLADGTVLLSYFVKEPTLTVLDGQVVVLIRTTADLAYLSRSTDNGRTWSVAQPTDMPASSHHALALTTGEVLVTYGDLSPRFSPRRDTTGRLVRQPLQTWDGYPDMHLYDSGHPDQANPSSAEVAPGRFLTLGVDLPAGTVVGVFTTRDDYL